MMLCDLATKYATKYHEGQVRKQYNMPYIVHPAVVVSLLESYGVKDEKTKAIGWLHDTLEDTTLTYEEIKQVFGQEVADGVKILSRDVDNESYKTRLKSGPANVQKVKLCDVIHNTSSLHVYNPKKIQVKVADCKDFYIPLAKALDLRIADHIEKNILPYS